MMKKRFNLFVIIIVSCLGFATVIHAADWPIIAISPLELPSENRFYVELKAKTRAGHPMMICPVAYNGNPNLNLYEQTELLGHKKTISSVSFSSNGRILSSGDEEGNIVIWEVDNKGVWSKSFVFPNKHNAKIIDLVFCLDDTTLLSLDANGRILRWEQQDRDVTGEPWDYIKKIKTGNMKNYCLEYHVSKHGYGTLLLGGRADGYIDLWIVRNGETFDYRDRIDDNRSSELNNPVISITILDYGDVFQLIRGYENGKVVILDTSSGTLHPKVLSSHNGPVWDSFTFSTRDNNYFATLSADRTIIIWDAKTLAELKGICTGYYYYRGLIKGMELFDIGRTMPLPELEMVESAKAEEISNAIASMAEEYKINHTNSGRDSFQQLVEKVKQTYPDYPVSFVQFAPTEKVAQMRCLEEALGTYTLLYRYSYNEEDERRSSSSVAINQMILASPFTKFVSLAVGNSSTDLTDVRLQDEDYEYIEEYYFGNLKFFEEGKDYIKIANYNMGAPYNHWMAILLLKKEKNVVWNADHHEFFGYSDFGRPREAREIAKIVAITNIVNLIQCRILTKYVDIFEEMDGRVEGLLKSSFSYLHPKTVIRGIRPLESSYDNIHEYYCFKLGISDEEYNRLKQSYD